MRKTQITKKRTTIIFVLLFVVLSQCIFAQRQKYYDYLEIAQAFKEVKSYAKAIEYFTLAYNKSHEYSAIKSLAECNLAIRNYTGALEWFQILENSTFIDSETLLEYVYVLKMNGLYDKAKDALNTVKSIDTSKDSLIAVLNDWCDTAKIWIASPSDYTIKNLSTLNSEFSELNPIFSGSGIIFSSNRYNSEYKDIDEQTLCPYFNLYESVKSGGDEYTKVSYFDKNINSRWHDISCTFTKMIDTIYYCSSKKTSSGERFQIYRSSKTSGSWSKPAQFMLNDSSYSYASPTISANGQMFVFASNQPGGEGGIDLYVSYRIDSTWTKPINMGNVINTGGNEINPFFHEDGTLYFASNGHNGMGGYDLFYCKLTDDGWAPPQNLRIPFNSSADDLSICLNFNKSIAVISSNRAGGYGKEDIYVIVKSGGK